MANWLQEFQSRNRALRQEEIDDSVFESTGDNILKAASAMLEANVQKDKIKGLLIKYWDLRPSDAEFFIEKAESIQS